MLLVVSLIVVAICEAKRKRKKFSEKKFGVRSGQSEEGGVFFNLTQYKVKLSKSKWVLSKFFEFWGVC